MFDLSDVLHRANIPLDDVNVMLHSPRSKNGDLLTLLPGLVKTRRAAMETYQAVHSQNAERALSRGRTWVASFVKTGNARTKGASEMLFVGLYHNKGAKRMTREAIAAHPEVQWLYQNFGVFAEIEDESWTHRNWFDLELSDRLADLQGRLLIEVHLTQSYLRLAENLTAPIVAIHPNSQFDAGPPGWQRMRPSAGMMGALPASWADCLRQWRGVYLIVDETDGARYVGSAYGEENLLGRWRQHVAGEFGVTVGLAKRDPSRFRFSILELVSPQARPEEVIQLEQTWMDRLETVRFGLNRAKEGTTCGA